MAYFYHLKSNFFSKKCIFLISDTNRGAKKYDRYRRVRRCRMVSDLIDDVEKKQATQIRNQLTAGGTEEAPLRLTNGGSTEPMSEFNWT